MSLFLFDANIWIGLSKGDPTLTSHLAVLSTGEVASCSVVRAELLFGARKSRNLNKNVEVVQRLLSPYVSLPFDDAAAGYYGIIRADLERAGTPIGHNDLMIASIACAHDCVLITRNLREFQRVPGLRVESW